MGAKARILLAFLCAGSLVSVGYWCRTTAAAQMPSASFFAAALEHMEYLADGTLRMDGVYLDDAADAPLWTFRYVRTPDIIYLERDDGALAARMSYDRVTDLFRSLVTMKATDETRGIEQYGLSGTDLNAQIIPDIPLYRALGGRARDAIRRAQVHERLEMVQGHPCYRVDAAGGQTGPTRGTFWMDPALGLALRRILLVWPGDVSSKDIVFSEYSEVAPDLWLPRVVDMITTTTVVPPGFQGDSLTVHQRVTITELEVGLSVDNAAIEVNLPLGGTADLTPDGATVYTYGRQGDADAEGAPGAPGPSTEAGTE